MRKITQEVVSIQNKLIFAFIAALVLAVAIYADIMLTNCTNMSFFGLDYKNPVLLTVCSIWPAFCLSIFCIARKILVDKAMAKCSKDKGN